MGWFDKLKHFIKVDIKLNAPIFCINYNKDLKHINLEGGHYYDKERKILHLNPENLPKEIQEILSKTTKQFIEEGNRLLENKTDDLLDKLYSYNKENPDNAVLSFFNGIIPPNDYESLQASLFLRSRFKLNEDVTMLKNGIRKRFGDRGNNISNLCTAGYFEEFLMPLYNASREDFRNIYEDIVNKSIVAIFVHRNMNSEEIPKEISKRIEISKKYGIKFIHIHGISNNNVKKIKQCIEEKKKYFEFFEKKIYENEEKDIIVVQLVFN